MVNSLPDLGRSQAVGFGGIWLAVRRGRIKPPPFAFVLDKLQILQYSLKNTRRFGMETSSKHPLFVGSEISWIAHAGAKKIPRRGVVAAFIPAGESAKIVVTQTLELLAKGSGYKAPFTVSDASPANKLTFQNVALVRRALVIGKGASGGFEVYTLATCNGGVAASLSSPPCNYPTLQAAIGTFFLSDSEASESLEQEVQAGPVEASGTPEVGVDVVSEEGTPTFGSAWGQDSRYTLVAYRKDPNVPGGFETVHARRQGALGMKLMCNFSPEVPYRASSVHTANTFTVKGPVSADGGLAHMCEGLHPIAMEAYYALLRLKLFAGMESSSVALAELLAAGSGDSMEYPTSVMTALR